MLADILYALLLSTSIAPTAPGLTETTEERNTRLRSIADDAAAVAKDNAADALLILAVAHHESAFALDVDKGPCYRGKDGRGIQCDSGQAACMLQIHYSSEAQRERLFADRRYCFRLGLKALKSSMGFCSSYGEDYQFGAYAAGDCQRGLKGSHELTRYWKEWLGRYYTEKAKEEREDK